MATTVDFGSGGDAVQATTQSISVRQLWTDDWTDLDLYCTSATWTCAPNMSTATCLWTYGWIKPTGETQWGYRAKRDESQFSRWYIRITFTVGTDTRIWYGVIADVDDEHRGHVQINGNEYESGEQTLHCYGMEYLLDQEPIASSWCYDGDPANLLRIDAPVIFNKNGRGNRTDSRYNVVAPAYLFDGTPENPLRTYRPKWDDWSTRDIVEYLLNMLSPGQTAPDYIPTVRFALDSISSLHLADDDRPILNQEGATVWSLLNRLIDRRRLRTFYIDVNVNPQLNVVPLNRDDITLPDGRTITGADLDRVVDLDCDRDPLTTARVRQADTIHADYVIVRGARRTSTGTFYFDTNRLEEGWTAAQETAYGAAASGEVGYAGWDSLKQRTRNKEVRGRVELAPVYCWFRVPDSWDQYVGATATDRVCFPDDDDDTVQHTQYVHEVTIDSELALWENIDYSSSDEVTEGSRSIPRDYVRRDPLLVMKRPDDGRHVIASQMRQAAEGECDPLGTGTSTRFNCILRVQPDSRVIEVHVQGEEQYAIAYTDFTPLAADRDVGEYDYASKNMLATLTVVDNRFCEGRWPEAGYNPAGGIDAQRGYIIWSEREYRQDFLALDTVVDVADDGTLTTTSTAGYVQDDTKTLQGYARLIYEWYTATRYAITLSTYRIGTAIELGLGYLVETFAEGGHAITPNTVITETTIDCPRGTDNQRTEVRQTFSTGFGELDVLALMPPDPRRS